MVVASGSLPYLHPNCHHQIAFAKLHLKLTIHHPIIATFGIILSHQGPDTECIRQAIDFFRLEESFTNCSVNEKVAIFNKTILDILHNFVPHGTLLVDDKDSPWLINKIKKLINKKSKVFKQNSNSLQILNKLESLQNILA